MTAIIINEPNQKQKECIENIEGKYLVLAGPGTGKTYTIIHRIKNMIEKNINPKDILCLTFTDAASNEMKIRIENLLNSINLDLNIYTYHGFCNEILETYPDEFELPSNFKIITDDIKRVFIKEIIDEIKPQAFRTEKNDPYYYIDTIKRRIEEIKKNRLTKEKYFNNIETNPDWKIELNNLEQKLKEKIEKKDTRTITLEGDIERQKKKINQAIELWQFFELYQEKMSKKHYLDFNDMINLVLDKFEIDPSFLSAIANKYKYIMVDEYQDTNTSQNCLIQNLLKAQDKQNIFIVGDDNQIIYTFQGAKLDTIENFLENFPDTKVICLNENMRSTQNILDIAKQITNQDSKRLEINPKFSKYNISKDLISKNKDLNQNINVRFNIYLDEIEEYNSIIDEIEELINSKSCPLDKKNEKKLNEIAILTRTNSELNEYYNMLKQRGIPAELKDGKSIFEIKSSIVLLSYMQMLVNPELYSDKIYEILLSKPFNINNLDYIKIKENISKEKCILNCIKSIDINEFKEKEKIQKFLNDYEYLTEYKNKESIKNTVLEIGSKTGIFDYYINYDINKAENIAGLKKLIDLADEYSDTYKTVGLEDFIEYINILIEDEIDILTEKAPVSLNAVQLSTYYSAKGREFEYVYMPALTDKKWESDNNSFKPEIPLDIKEYKTKDELNDMKLSDRIKVMYVGMTRAKHTLRLSAPSQINKKSKKVSKLISNIENMLEKNTPQKSYSEESYWSEVSKTLIKRPYDYKKEFNVLIDSKIKDRSYSPSSINLYLNCKRQFLYKYILELDSKTENPDNLSYGSAIHGVMEFAVKYAIKNKEYPKLELLIEEFNKIMPNLIFSDFEHRQIYLKRGQDAIKNYYPILLNTPCDMLYEVEKDINYKENDIKFYGIIDRIDKNQDGTYTIYDYKTGNAKKKYEIAPNGSYENYYNQMGLYKYFYEHLTKNKVSKTKFIFVEDFKNNVEIEYTKEDLDEIISKFKEAVKNISEYDFEPNYNKENCKHCSYKTFCNLDII